MRTTSNPWAVETPCIFNFFKKLPIIQKIIHEYLTQAYTVSTWNVLNGHFRILYGSAWCIFGPIRR